MGIEKLERILNPKRVAVIGASEREGSIGGRILQNLTDPGYEGEVFPVNPFRRTVQGRISYPRISSVPEPIDLAIIATPADTVPSIVEECGASQIPGVIIISAGFKETGEHGRELERQLHVHQKKYGIRIIGPHSLGIIVPKTSLFATFAEKRANPGKIAFISQSAALCASALDWAWDTGVGLSAIVSTGSMLDVDMGDLIDYFGMDPETKSIMLYVEHLKNPRKFMSAAREFARDKPISVLKAGRFQESREVSLSHSGALAGEDAIYDAAFKRAGMVRVRSMSELFNCIQALTMQPSPTGTGLTIITNAGGPAILATDRLIARRGKLALLTPETTQALKTVLPPYCSVTNPIDVYEEATSERFRNVLEICLKDSNTNGFLILYTPQGSTDPLFLAAAIVELAKQANKPVLTSLMSQDDRSREARRTLLKAGIPSFTTPEEAVSTFMNMYRHTQNLELLYQTPQEMPLEKIDAPMLKGILRRAFCEGRRVLNLSESMRFLEEYRIPAVTTIIAKTIDEANAASSQLGYPVVMKALSSQITHKSKIQGVVLNVCFPAELKVFFEELTNKVKQYSDTSDFQGVAIQPMVRERGCELLLGSKTDVQFGPVILFGRGGTAAESFNDISIGFPPLNQITARRLIEETTIYKQTSTTSQPFNANIIEEILVKFSQLVSDFPQIAAIDINPLIASPNTAVAVDARIVIDWDRFMREVAEHREQSLIAAYPAKYVATRKLNNGAEVVLRPIKAEDENRFNDLIKSLSAQSMRFRFFEIIKEMSHEKLVRYCNLDYDRQIAIVAELRDSKQIIGAGRVIAEPAHKSGEFAVLIADNWQGQGLGSRLMDYVISVGKDMRLERIFAYVLSDNHKMLKLCEKKGFTIKPLDDETVKVQLALL